MDAKLEDIPVADGLAAPTLASAATAAAPGVVSGPAAAPSFAGAAREREAGASGSRRMSRPAARFAAESEPPCEERGRQGSATRLRMRVIVLSVIALLAVAVGLACWRYLPGVLAWLADAQAVRAFVEEHAFISRVTLLGINMIQIALAFLPGEPIELASGYAFGFLEGTALCLLACAIASSAVFFATRRWGWRLVGVFFDRSMLDRFSWLHNTRRLEIVMLVLFLIPGTPKDFLTYFAGLTEMRYLPVLFITTLGRIPSIVTSTIAAAAIGSGEYLAAAIALVVALALVAVGGLAYKALRRRVER